jgi:hypothetical protein
MVTYWSFGVVNVDQFLMGNFLSKRSRNEEILFIILEYIMVEAILKRLIVCKYIYELICKYIYEF